MEFTALRKPSALFKYAEILFGFLALVLYRGAKLPLWEVSNSTILWMNPNLDESYVVLGSLLGLFLSTVVFPFALVLGHEPGPMVSRPLASLGKRGDSLPQFHASWDVRTQGHEIPLTSLSGRQRDFKQYDRKDGSGEAAERCPPHHRRISRNSDQKYQTSEITDYQMDHEAIRLGEMVHGGMCTVFYMATGSILIHNVSDSHQSKEARLILTSGVFCILLAFVFMANVLFVTWKWRKNTG
ncbi:unnamed protein product [Darwinula stevensoni]|uniref:Uncharacterized protein n=1 Tax=Darwinula stevensoni TaxID=69355 RepID=A0A7R8X6K5_9CRUS|nr:unnamed protein product [Darwinula stevensoni]CAG0888208.1 unnamed protein product [Darwinula stevensoni]